MPFQSSPLSLENLTLITLIHRPYMHPQILVRRSAARLARSTAARVRPICSYGLPQRGYLGQWFEEPHEHAPQRSWPRLVLLVQFLHVIGTHVATWLVSSCLQDIKVLLGAIVVKSPGCKLARNALALLDQSFTLYEEGSALCRPPATVVCTNIHFSPWGPSLSLMYNIVHSQCCKGFVIAPIIHFPRFAPTSMGVLRYRFRSHAPMISTTSRHLVAQEVASSISHLRAALEKARRRPSTRVRRPYQAIFQQIQHTRSALRTLRRLCRATLPSPTRAADPLRYTSQTAR